MQKDLVGEMREPMETEIYGIYDTENREWYCVEGRILAGSDCLIQAEYRRLFPDVDRDTTPIHIKQFDVFGQPMELLEPLAQIEEARDE